MSLRYALLAAIDETPSTGYALSRRFNEGLAHVWSANHQQVYRELGRLEKEGLLSVTVESQAGKPDRKRYAITAAGIEALMKITEVKTYDLRYPLAEPFANSRVWCRASTFSKGEVSRSDGGGLGTA